VYFGGRSPGQRNFQNWKGPNEAINWAFQISEVSFEKKRPQKIWPFCLFYASLGPITSRWVCLVMGAANLKWGLKIMPSAMSRDLKSKRPT